MTAASELKSAAVVQERAQQESRKRKTPGQEAVVSGTVEAKKESKEEATFAVKEVTEVRNEARRESAAEQQAANGSTTAGATQTVAAAHETSGSSAAIASKAASLQATRLPVSVFSRIRESQHFSRIQYRCGLVCRGVRRVQVKRQGGWSVNGPGAVQAV